MAAVRKKFEKFECEDIRTEYFLFDGEDTKPAGIYIPSRTIVEFNSGTKVLQPKDNAQASDVDNESVFLLAEDYHGATDSLGAVDAVASDKGFVYFIIERTANLV